MALVDEALVPHLADDPPDRFDVLVRQRPVRVLGVDPDAGSLGQRGPVLDVARDGVTTALGELGNTERLDLVLVLEPELLLDLDLDGEPMAVPSALAGDVVAAHRLEAGIEVLEHAGPDVMQARVAHSPSAAPRRRSRARHPCGAVWSPRRRPAPANEPTCAPRARRGRGSGRPGRTAWTHGRRGPGQFPEQLLVHRRRHPPLRFGWLLLASLGNRCFRAPGGVLRRPTVPRNDHGSLRARR